MMQFCFHIFFTLSIIKTFFLFSSYEEPFLENITQITFSEMGFEKAGEAYFSPDDRRIIFQAVPHGDLEYQIYSMSLEERNPLLISTGIGACTCAYFHPDGKIIAFTTSLHGHKRYEIYLLHLETGALSRLTNFNGFDGLPVFSHDGKKLLWTSKRSMDGSCQIFIADFINPF